MSNKLKVGDHVIVVDDGDYGGGQVCLTGTITKIIRGSNLPIEIRYDSSNDTYNIGDFNRYKDYELECSVINDSPLMKALR